MKRYSSALCALLVLITQNTFAQQTLVDAALERTKHRVTYDGTYYAIPYPNGDVPNNIGVCTDVVIRSYRKVGIDLQERVHEDIRQHFSAYPSQRIWGHTKPDKNIDHRRVPNLQTFFSRHGKKLAITENPEDYKAGDLVTWMLPGNLPHIGIVSNQKSSSGVPLIVHNIGRGPKLEDMLFSASIDGHYRYFPASAQEME
ncbi:hypothetical protein SAMN02745866_01590 [Alteromonadaceae bacterium Bs31]|nr:hypothetical protein SAMN02745866_01590 [Alteromonadaceae bacterium Bs31]